MSQIDNLKEILKEGASHNISPDSPKLFSDLLRKDLSDEDRISLYLCYCYYSCGMSLKKMNNIFQSITLDLETIEKHALHVVNNL